MAVTQYIGARYVPIFADPAEWDSTRAYEPLTIVIHEGASYTSKQAVPIGIDINNTKFWACTGNYNAQVEQYRREVQTFDGRITENENDIADEISARTSADTNLQNLIDAETEARENADRNLHTFINEETEARIAADNRETEARVEADNYLNEEIDKIKHDNKNKNYYLYPLQEGRVRVNTNTFTPNPSDPNTTPRYAQGLCVAGNYIYQMLYASGTQTAHVYRKLIGGDIIERIAAVETGHSSDIIFIPEIDQFWISHGAEGKISRFTPGFDLLGTFTIGSTATLIAYDKVTHKVYADDYWGATYEVNPVTLEYTQINTDLGQNSYKQSIAAHDDTLYVLYSYPSCIEAYNLNNELISKYYIGDNHYTPIGETEGIDTNSNGDFYMSSYIVARNSSIWLNPIWYLSLEQVNIEPPYNYYGRDVIVDSHTDANLRSHQRPNGTADAPFPTIDEALLYCYQNRHLNRLNITGDHSMEQPEITLPYIAIQGQAVSGVKASIGRITAMGSTSIFQINFDPKISVPNVVTGYQNTSIVLASNVSKTATAPITGADVSSVGPIHQGTTSTATLPNN